MKKAGDYTDSLVWQLRTVAKNSTGQDVETFTPNGRLWANVSPDTGRREDESGGIQTGQTGTIRLRNYPGVSALDRLYRPEWDELWIIENIVNGDNERICSAFTRDGG